MPGEHSDLSAKSAFQQRGVRSWTRSAGCCPMRCTTSTPKSYGLMPCSSASDDQALRDADVPGSGIFHRTPDDRPGCDSADCPSDGGAKQPSIPECETAGQRNSRVTAWKPSGDKRSVLRRWMRHSCFQTHSTRWIGLPRPDFVEIRNAPFGRVFARNDFQVAAGLAELDDFRQDARVRAG